MKIFILILALAATAAAASAQAADHFVSVPAAGMGGNVGAVRFWTRSTIALTALDGWVEQGKAPDVIQATRGVLIAPRIDQAQFER